MAVLVHGQIDNSAWPRVSRPTASAFVLRDAGHHLPICIKVMKAVLSRAVISDHFANSSENIMRNRSSTPQNLKKGHQNSGFASHFACFRVLGVGIPVSHNIFRGICKIITNDRSRQYTRIVTCDAVNFFIYKVQGVSKHMNWRPKKYEK